MLVSQSPSGFVMDFMQGFEIGYELQYDTKPIIVRPVANAVPGTFLPGRCHPQRALPPIAPGALPKPKHGREVNPVGPTRTNEQAPQTTKFRCVVTLRPQLMYMPSSQACKEMFFSARRELKRGKTAITPVHKDISETTVNKQPLSDTCALQSLFSGTVRTAGCVDFIRCLPRMPSACSLMLELFVYLRPCAAFYDTDTR